MKKDFLGQLNELDQADIIWDQGVLIGKRNDGFYKILLFQVDAFYAEMYYHAHFNVIIRIKTFTGTEGLEPYLQQIQIDHLLNN